MGVLYLIICLVSLYALLYIVRATYKYNFHVKEIQSQERDINDLNRLLNDERREVSHLMKCIKEKDEFYHSASALNNVSIKYISEMYSDILTVQDDITSSYLKRKSRPAFKEAYRIRECKAEKRKYIEQYKIMLYKYELLLNLFPELSAYVEDYEDIKKISSYRTLNDFMDEYDKAKDWISKEEYLKMGEDERNQLALDRYISHKNKSKWQIGRDYELYVGYLFRREGWQVIQHGIERKLNDLGRDIIASKRNKDGHIQIRIVQCKMWSKEREIHENTICQLYGTTIQFIIENDISDKSESVNTNFTNKLLESVRASFDVYNSVGFDVNNRVEVLAYQKAKEVIEYVRKINSVDVRPVFVTTTELSKTAVDFAKHLGLKIKIVDLGDFPRIKCNIGKNGEKIYHLPFDQQYDTTIIDKEGEFYAWTVKEATNMGFRRAFKYYGGY